MTPAGFQGLSPSTGPRASLWQGQEETGISGVSAC